MEEQISAADTNRHRYPILNTYVNDLTMDETIACVEQIIAKRQPVQHVVINASKINLIRKDPELGAIINSCPIINADGASILLAARLLHIPLKERVTGIDLFLKLVELAHRKHYRIFLFGAEEEVVRKVKKTFETQYPGIQIAGYRNGYFTQEDEPQIVEQMKAAKADIMFVGFSSPRKEYWVHRYLDQLQIPFVMGVGGSFDVLAGKTKRAPRWMQACGLEWLFRFLQEPGRLWKRYLVGNVSFLIYVLSFKWKAMFEGKVREK